jgi:hypothetical protein
MFGFGLLELVLGLTLVGMAALVVRHSRRR